MCTVFFWATDQPPLFNYPIETLRQFKTLCQLFGWELEDLIPEVEDISYEDENSCLCPIGIYDLIALDRLDIEYETFDDGTASILSYPDISYSYPQQPLDRIQILT